MKGVLFMFVTGRGADRAGGIQGIVNAMTRNYDIPEMEAKEIATKAWDSNDGNSDEAIEDAIYTMRKRGYQKRL